MVGVPQVRPGLSVCYCVCCCRVSLESGLENQADNGSGYQIALTGSIIAFRGFVLQYGEGVSPAGAVILRADHLGECLTDLSQYVG